MRPLTLPTVTFPCSCVLPRPPVVGPVPYMRAGHVSSNLFWTQSHLRESTSLGSTTVGVGLGYYAPPPPPLASGSPCLSGPWGSLHMTTVCRVEADGPGLGWGG